MQQYYFGKALSSLLMCLLLSPLVYSQNYPGEKPIVFTTMDGKTTNAFEGSIEVPENRSDTNSRMIPLKYVRFPATGKIQGSPIVYLSGGPGGSGIMTAKYPNFRFPLFMALREFGDVIALDQRGTGASDDTPECVSNQHIPMTEVLNDEKITKFYRLAAAECLSFWADKNVDVLGYTTVESARDLDALREHLQAKKLTLWGISYGSHLAFSALKEMPGKIDKVVIASAEGLNQTVKLPADTDAYFVAVQAAINTQEDAKAAYPDLKSLIHRVYNKLLTHPLPLKLLQEDGSIQNLLLQKTHLQMLASAMIADPHRGLAQLLAIFKELDEGRQDTLLTVLKRGMFNDNNISFRVMPFAMDIASGITQQRLDLANKQAPDALLGLALNFPMPQLNKVVSGLDLGDDFRSGPTSDVPTLLLSGTLDGRTYIDSQMDAVKGLSNLTKVTVVNAGHNLFMRSELVTKVIKEFLAGDKISTTSIEIPLPNFAPQTAN
jgi:pimeloyl-ACP methyl ester carboxylesterase